MIKALTTNAGLDVRTGHLSLHMGKGIGESSRLPSSPWKSFLSCKTCRITAYQIQRADRGNCFYQSWIQNAIFVLPHGPTAGKTQCYLAESCNPYVITSSGGPAKVPVGQVFDANGVDTAWVWMNLFPLSKGDGRISVNVTFEFDKACWRADKFCPLYIK